ncbi:hypothetical protein SODALDRAFT_329562 [Sodiomyces alkalinus F11]|uniref:Altered inheritance of mitochondria protein 11 n=1 Tax=Sodiomyces alkalinus (strain CBS 110278 / VKM F-3762 / F11) TaxID=1314773 RepID=A0A3N2PJU0_SODAK|nr:hypothetical protein SODALDRAFT_329562 [Sodiomyces alkalinus F11]ROT34700.1 hypothetical protein SODALDRAFT_329562 [Sodiomyces alkalinus F11]
MLANGTPLAMATPPGAQTPSPSSSAGASSRSPSSRVDNRIVSPRSINQLGLFFAGAGFTLVSALITRRAVVRKKISALPKFYHTSHAPAGLQGNAEGSLIAIEALGLATLNVVSVGIMATGGLAWAFDLSSLEDLRERSRQSLYGHARQTDEAGEREMEEFATMLLTKLGKAPPLEDKQDKDKNGQAQKDQGNENEKGSGKRD